MPRKRKQSSLTDTRIAKGVWKRRRPEQTILVVGGEAASFHAAETSTRPIYNKDTPPKIDRNRIEQFSTGAVRRATTPSRTDLIPLQALLALGERYHYGATVRGYGDRNWEAGIPYANLLQHIQEHLSHLCTQLIKPEAAIKTSADDPRQNAAAIMWNAAAIIHFLHHGNPAEEPQP